MWGTTKRNEYTECHIQHRVFDANNAFCMCKSSLNKPKKTQSKNESVKQKQESIHKKLKSQTKSVNILKISAFPLPAFIPSSAFWMQVLAVVFDNHVLQVSTFLACLFYVVLHVCFNLMLCFLICLIFVLTYAWYMFNLCLTYVSCILHIF